MSELIGPLNDVEQRFAEPVYVAGDEGLLRDTVRVSVVGSRMASDLGLRRAGRLAAALAGEGIVVVSGLALGIDTVAHRTSIDRGGRTIAVLGTPLDHVYPRENASLFSEIAAGHLAISQFEPGKPVQRGNFPRRNRTMALISHATVIIEAGETSGSLSQGWEALRLGRPLLVARSVVEDPQLSWPRELLDHGASVLTDEADLLEVLPERDLADLGGPPF